jgi:hypothetical protein
MIARGATPLNHPAAGTQRSSRGTTPLDPRAAQSIYGSTRDER